MNRIVLCLPMEVKFRELNPRLYLGLTCIKKNPKFSALIGFIYNVDKAMFNLNLPFIYFAKGLSNHPTFLSMYAAIKESGSKIIYMDEEGGPSRKDVEYFLMRFSEEALKYVDLFCFWGELQRDIIMRHRPCIAPGAAVVTGHPRFDLMKPQFAGIHRKLCTQTQRRVKSKPYLLFNMNLPMGNSLLPPDEYYEMFNDMYQRRMNKVFSRDIFNVIFSYETDLLKAYGSAIKELSEKFPDLNIVVRPHPVENPAPYRTNFFQLNNVIVTNEGSAQEWIVDATSVIHTDCTTSVETYFNGRTPVSYIPVKANDYISKEFHNETHLAISQKITSEKDLIGHIESLMKTEIDTSTQPGTEEEKILCSTYANLHFNSAELIAEKTEDIAETIRFFSPGTTVNDHAQSISYPHGFVKFAKRILRPQYQKIKAIMAYKTKNTIREQGSMTLYENAKFPGGLTQREVEDRISVFRERDPYIPEVRVTEVMPYAFLLERA